MNNQELEIKVKELLEIQNFFDFIEAVKGFEKEYKNTDFYKKTKLPILEMIKNAKGFYFLQLNDLFNKLQEKINAALSKITIEERTKMMKEAVERSASL